ncbi:MAG: hypothetical protein LDL56_06245 [Armatimonadetes bacterium]|jgi:hypothetical protein|nr:hypothetical protein [Armatimonadota bacterium]
MHHTENYEPDVSRGHEAGDIRLRPLLLAIVGFFAFTIVSILATVAIFEVMVPGGFASRFQPDVAVRRLPPEPLPRLQSNFTAKKDMADVRRRERQILESYGPSEAAPGKARVPLDVAIEAVARQGLPRWDAPASAKEAAR